MSFAVGFRSLTASATDLPLPVKGELPAWLSGALVRNGPAQFSAGASGSSFRHWFDGQAMLHRFSFSDGAVSYTNRPLDTPSSLAARDGRIRYAEFATDPCGTLFSRFFTRFTRKPSTNTNVNVARVDGRTVALTEVPLAVEFDASTLATVGVVAPGGPDGQVTTAHPHAVPETGELVNYVLKFGRNSVYKVYRDSGVVGEVTAAKPGYVHSFAITTTHVVLAIFPLVVNPLSFLLRGRPFIENYRWRPELGTRFVAVSLADGSQREWTAPACFGFHHINAFSDGGDDTDLVVDLCAADDASIVDALYLDRLRGGAPVPLSRPRRYRLGADGSVTVAALAEEPLELPRINYGAVNGRPYRYAYGVGQRGDFLDQLVKLTVPPEPAAAKLWREEGCFPGEPVFVAAPTANKEDDGVILSVVLDAAGEHSFLLVLEAASFTELARAEVPHAIPFGFHGQYWRG